MFNLVVYGATNQFLKWLYNLQASQCVGEVVIINEYTLTKFVADIPSPNILPHALKSSCLTRDESRT
jgi:hypothetical protein